MDFKKTNSNEPNNQNFNANGIEKTINDTMTNTDLMPFDIVNRDGFEEGDTNMIDLLEAMHPVLSKH